MTGHRDTRRTHADIGHTFAHQVAIHSRTATAAKLRPATGARTCRPGPSRPRRCSRKNRGNRKYPASPLPHVASAGETQILQTPARSHHNNEDNPHLWRSSRNNRSPRDIPRRRRAARRVPRCRYPRGNPKSTASRYRKGRPSPAGQPDRRPRSRRPCEPVTPRPQRRPRRPPPIRERQPVAAARSRRCPAQRPPHNRRDRASRRRSCSFASANHRGRFAL